MALTHESDTFSGQQSEHAQFGEYEGFLTGVLNNKKLKAT